MSYTKYLVKDLGVVITGKTPSTKDPENFSNETMFITPSDLKQGYILNTSERYISQKGFSSILSNTIDGWSVLVGCIGSDLGNIALSNRKCATNQQINSITKIKPNFNPLYIYYWFKQKKEFLMNIAGSTTTPIINKSSFENIEISLPDITEQNAVAKVLSCIDDKIALNNKINKELEQMAKTLYEYWFVQFDFPDEKGRPYKSANGKMVYNDILKREIPLGWEVKNLANNRLTTILKPGIDKFENEKIYLPTAAITDDKITDRSNTISYENRESRANMQPISNSVWFAKMKKTKKILYFGNYSQKYMNEIILSTGMLGLKCKENSLEYIWNFINDNYFEEIKDRLAHGATQESINNEDLMYIPILVPDDTILQKFATKVKELYQKKYYNEIENEELIQLRDFLLPLLMNGQVSVSSEH